MPLDAQRRVRVRRACGRVPRGRRLGHQMAAAAVAAMPLGRLDEATTANAGFSEGGGATNAVPDACTLVGRPSLHAERRYQKARL
ncbi:MAG: hypothetical protein ACLTMP_02200 [Eggerthella lenta]